MVCSFYEGVFTYSKAEVLVSSMLLILKFIFNRPITFMCENTTVRSGLKDETEGFIQKSSQ